MGRGLTGHVPLVLSLFARPAKIKQIAVVTGPRPHNRPKSYNLITPVRGLARALNAAPGAAAPPYLKWGRGNRRMSINLTPDDWLMFSGLAIVGIAFVLMQLGKG